ncbi:MAG: aldehyde ferredoxin oxidoreductase family protein [Coriobacteriia bacterium]|nr:aldehyde ferredoxin oxidoreductase family protein [Coriobacteriia bacterium]
MKSYNGKLLRVNLTEGTIKKEPLDEDLARKYIGGRGLGTKILMDEIDPQVDPLSPENKMLVMTGPLSGTTASTGTRYMVITKGALNNMIASSNSGGHFGAWLKYAGYDGIIFEGKAASPVYLDIHDDEVELKDASALWGKTSEEVVAALGGDDKNSSVLNIGPAGEHLSLLAGIMNDTDRAAGRTGVGAVMGSKNLKAIHVVTENRRTEAADPDKFREVSNANTKMLKEHPVTGEGLPTFGTAVLVNIINGIGSLPVKNWQSALNSDPDSFSGETMADERLVRNNFCHHCTIGCGRVVKMGDKVIGGPEYEPLWAYGSSCDVHDLDAIIEANYWCNELGLDAIGAASTIAAGMELYQIGAIPEADCEGVPLEFGSGKAIVEWTKHMGRADNALGKLMAQGSWRLCEHYGHPELSMSVKKQEMPAYDGRGVQGIGLNYATSNRGGCHVRGYTISPEVLGAPMLVDRTTTEGKAELVKVFQDLTAAIDSLGLCLFTSFALGAGEYAALFSAAIGEDISADEIMTIGERIYNIERQFNKLAGMKPEDDTLPKRLLDEPLTDNEASEGMVSHLDVMLPEYYKARGWVDAFPTEETLARLEIV